MDWFKIQTKGWLQGSIRRQLNMEQRSIWIDLLALASDCRIRDGSLRHGVNEPMDREYIAAVLRIPLEKLNETIAICSNDKNEYNDRHRVEILEDGTIVIANFEKYQSIPPVKEKVIETDQERKLRELRQQSVLNRKYPETAITQHTEIITDKTGNVIARKKTNVQVVSHEHK